mgnify:CR=1 FL=1
MPLRGPLAPLFSPEAEVQAVKDLGLPKLRPWDMSVDPKNRPPLRPFDLILIDPPYGSGLAQIALDRIAGDGWLAPGGWISVETAAEKLCLPARIEATAERRFGKANILLLRCRCSEIMDGA